MAVLWKGEQRRKRIISIFAEQQVAMYHLIEEIGPRMSFDQFITQVMLFFFHIGNHNDVLGFSVLMLQGNGVCVCLIFVFFMSFEMKLGTNDVMIIFNTNQAF